MGPALGGGFGKYQGYLGLVTDNIITLETVLADGTITNVSEHSHPDLYWGMRGAGHNFGIVTRLEMKLYDDPVPNWFYAEMQFTGDKLEAYSELMNSFNSVGTQPKELALIYGLIAMNNSVSLTDPIILSQFTFAGTEEDASKSPWIPTSV